MACGGWVFVFLRGDFLMFFEVEYTNVGHPRDRTLKTLYCKPFRCPPCKLNDRPIRD